MVRHHWPIVWILLILTGFWGFSRSHLCAQTIAVMPFADFSRGGNSIDLPFTEDFQKAMASQGCQTVAQDLILKFLVDNRIRYSGYMDSFMARKIGRSLSCDLIVLGSITEMEDDQEKSLGFTLSVFDARTGYPVWGGTRSASLEDGQRVLGIGNPRTIDDLKSFLFEGLAEEIDRNHKLPKVARVRNYQLVDIQLTPTYLKGGEPVNCMVKLKFLDTEPPLKIAIENGHGKIYLRQNGKPGVYKGQWPTPARDGRYPVNVVMEWEGQSERITDATYYEVLNRSPRLVLDVRKGMDLGRITAFSDHVILLPSMDTYRPLQRWTVTIQNSHGVTVLDESTEGDLPPRLVWSGQDSLKRKLEDDVFTFNLKVWDAAGNEAEVKRKLALQSSVLPVNLAAVRLGDKTYLRIRSTRGGRIPVESWNLNAVSSQGEALVEQQGVHLPAFVEIPSGCTASTILCNLDVRDQLGNRYSLLNHQVRVQVPQAESADDKAKSGKWVEDF